MFGRSGQMFPRQRAFHDAIYEEEYGSEQEDECCQSRGMSAVFCWFLSVIILIGLAASAVLTVFFILKSKSTISKNGELDVLYDGEHGINFHFPSTTESNSLDFQISASSSRESSFHNNKPSFEEDDEDETENSDFGTTTSKATTTSTRFPPSRRGPFEMSKEKSSEESNKPKTTGSGPPQYNQEDFPQSASRESFNRPPSSDEILSEESPPNRSSPSKSNDESSSEHDRTTTVITTTMSTIPSQHVLFTSSPDTPVPSSTPYRRNLQTTRFPTGKTTFSTASTSLPEEDHDDDHDHEDHEDDESHVKNDQHESHQDHDEDEEDQHTPTQQEDSVTEPTVLYESKEREVDDRYKEEESQLNKMLLEEIPPHRDQEIEKSGSDTSKSREDSRISTLSSNFNLPTTTLLPPSREPTHNSRDPLARIIKNLAPKWGRNRTIETTTMSSGNHKYDFTISSKEKDRTRSKESEENSSKDKFRSKESSTRSTVIITPETALPTSQFKSSEFEVVKLGGKRGNLDKPISILNTIQSPNLSRRPDQQSQNSEGESPFLDILVGSEDHKSLVTKQTEDGIVTSAILPPWYANTGGNRNNNNTRNATERVDGSGESSETSTPEEGTGPKSVFSGFLDFFKKLPLQNDNQPGNPNSIVLKRPAGELLAQGSSHVVQNSENSLRHPPNFKDLVREIAPGLKPTPQSLDSGVVTDYIHPANNGYHYGSSDGGTNIYGYYPDEDQESDRTVEHHGVQSETLSDELMDGVQESPSHSIELQVGSEGSSEIVISEGDDEPYTRYGQAGSETRRQVVTAPFHGGGIRRPISKDDVEEDMDLDMKGSEIRPVFATVENAPQNLTTEKTGQHSYGSRISNVSSEMVDNSGEKKPISEKPNSQPSSFENEGSEVEEANDEREIPSHLQKGVPEESMGTGSYEEIEASGSREPGTGKWSEPDKFDPQSSIEVQKNQPPPTGSEEMKVNPDSGDSNEVLERRPVSQLDEGLYPDSADTSAAPTGTLSAETDVHQVFPEGYSSTVTTQGPIGSDESTDVEPQKPENKNSSSTGGFVAPTPVSFHDNKYSFSAPSSEVIFQSKDGWRPLVGTSENSEDRSHEVDQQEWQRRQNGKPTSLTNNSPDVPQNNRHNPSVPLSNQSFEEEEEPEEEGENQQDEDLNRYNWGDRERDAEKQMKPVVPTKVRFPENPTTQENFHSYEQHQSQSHPQQTQSQPQQPQVRPHPPQQQVQPQIPAHPPQQQGPSHIHQQPRPQQHLQPPPTQQQRHQFHYQNNHNIDRSKYMMRPALPPIVMRRPPIQGMPYGPNGGSRPQLIPQVQQQPQFVNSLHPTEFPHPINRRVFKNLGPRPRSNINWPTDETRKIDTAERRNG